MFNLNKIVMDVLRKHRVAVGQGTETKTFPEIMAEIDDKEARSEIVKNILGTLGAPVDSARQAHIDATNMLDHVHWLHGVDPGIPTVERTFEGFQGRKDWPDVSLAWETVIAWRNHTGPGLLTLSGPTGCGKSHLAIAAARDLYANDKPVVFREEAVLISELQGHIQTNSVDDFWGEIKLAPWLIIDDMGVAALGAFAKGKMDELINARWEGAEYLRTLITTNLISGEMPVRIASRLADDRAGQVVSIQASDYRRG